MIDGLRRAGQVQMLVKAWLATPTWPASKAFLEANPALYDPAVAEFLADTADDPELHRHLAILAVSERFDTETAYDIVTDPHAAEPYLANAIRSADANVLTLIAAACPALLQLPVSGPLAVGVMPMLGGQRPEAEAMLSEGAAHGTPTQQRAAAIAMRRLGLARPDLADAVERLAAILERAGATSIPDLRRSRLTPRTLPCAVLAGSCRLQHIVAMPQPSHQRSRRPALACQFLAPSQSAAGVFALVICKARSPQPGGGWKWQRGRIGKGYGRT